MTENVDMIIGLEWNQATDVLKWYKVGSDDKHLIKDGDYTLTFDIINQEWIPLDPNKDNFENKGITDLSNLILNTTKKINLNDKEDEATGQVFKRPVNFRAFKTITNISLI